MKIRWLAAAAILIVISGCGNRNEAANADQNKDMNNNKANAPVYSENGVRFEIPASWQNHFADSVSKNGTGENQYTTIEFTYTDDGAEVPVMMISKFTAAQWDKIKAQDKNAEKNMLGKSSSGLTIYHIYYEDLNYFTESAAKKRFAQVKKDAKALQTVITITE